MRSSSQCHCQACSAVVHRFSKGSLCSTITDLHRSVISVHKESCSRRLGASTAAIRVKVTSVHGAFEAHQDGQCPVAEEAGAKGGRRGDMDRMDDWLLERGAREIDDCRGSNAGGDEHTVPPC